MRHPFGEVNDNLPEEGAAGVSNDTPLSFVRLESESQPSVLAGELYPISLDERALR